MKRGVLLLMLLMAGLLQTAATESRQAQQEAPVRAHSSIDTSTRWLLSYGGRATADLPHARFHGLLRAGLPHYAVPWYHARGLNLTLPGGAEEAIASTPGSIVVDSDRFVTITGTFPREGDFKGLLWCDTSTPQPTLIFALMMQHLGVDEDHSGSLDIYTKRSEDLLPLPPPFIASLSEWERATKVTTMNSITMHDARNQTMPVRASVLRSLNAAHE